MTQTPDDPTLVDKRVEQYVKLRDHIDKLKERHAEELKPFIETQNLLSGWMLSFLERTGSQSIKTKAGSFYVTTRYSASLADADAFMKHVVSTGQFELLDRRANSTAVKDYIEKNKCPPPGVNMSAVQQVGVRRAPGT